MNELGLPTDTPNTVKNLRAHLIRLLGGKCSNPSCAWVNTDGTQGCTDIRCLQVDYRFGKGYQARCASGGSYNEYKSAIADPNRNERYQALCANCNWIKRQECREWSGAESIARHRRNDPLTPEVTKQYKNRLYYLWSSLTNVSGSQLVESESELKRLSKTHKAISRLETRLGMTVSDLLSDPTFRQRVDGAADCEEIHHVLVDEPKTTYDVIAKRFNISRSSVARIAKGLNIHRYTKQRNVGTVL